jgi:hypothetical protein
MDIKQSFLDSLKGLFKDEAEALVESEGLAAWSIPSETAISDIARPDTVILWLDETDVVELATAGDPTEVVDDA